VTRGHGRRPLAAVGFPLSAFRFSLPAVRWPLPAFRCPLPAFRCPLSAFRSPLSAFRCPLSAGRWPLPAFRLPLAAFRFPLSAGRFPLAAGRNPQSAFRCPHSAGRFPQSAYPRERRANGFPIQPRTRNQELRWGQKRPSGAMRLTRSSRRRPASQPVAKVFVGPKSSEKPPRPLKTVGRPGVPNRKAVGAIEAGDASVQSSMQPDAARRLCSRLKPEDFCHGLLAREML